MFNGILVLGLVAAIFGLLDALLLFEGLELCISAKVESSEELNPSTLTVVVLDKLRPLSALVVVSPSELSPEMFSGILSELKRKILSVEEREGSLAPRELDLDRVFGVVVGVASVEEAAFVLAPRPTYN